MRYPPFHWWSKNTALSENHHGTGYTMLSSYPAESSYHIESQVLSTLARAIRFGSSIAF
jgi:hypothetical protein